MIILKAIHCIKVLQALTITYYNVHMNFSVLEYEDMKNLLDMSRLSKL